MAINILQRPGTFSPAYNDLPVVVQSTNYASAGFKYIGVLKDISGTELATLKAKVYYSSTDKGVFNLKRILENYVTYDSDFDNLEAGEILAENSIMYYNFEIGEEYGDPVSETLGVASITGWVFNGSLGRREFESYASGTVQTSFLTNQTKIIRPSQKDWLYFVMPPGEDAERARYLSYDAGGNQIRGVDVELAHGGFGDAYYHVGKVPSGHNTTEATNSISGGGDPAPIVDPDATHYTIQLIDSLGSAISELKTVTFNKECTQYEAINVYYLNPLGGFDSFLFDLKNKQEFQTTRKQFKRSLYELSGNSYTYNNDKHAQSNYDVRDNEMLTLNSNWISDAEAGDLRHLIASPVVFMERADGVITPIQIETDMWESERRINNPLFNCQIKVSIADNYRRQHG